LTIRLKKLTGLRKRWMFSNVVIMIVLVVIMMLMFTLSMGIYYYSTASSDLYAKAETAAGFFSDFINLDYNDYYQSCAKFAQSFDDSEKLELQFISADGYLVASSYGPWTGQEIRTRDVQQALSTQEIAVFNGMDSRTQEHIMAASTPMVFSNGENVGVLRYVTSLRLINRQVFTVLLFAVLCGAVFVMIYLLSSGFFIRSIVNPISEINEVAKRITDGSYGTQIQKKFNDEVGELADTINEMSVKISQTEKMQREFISSVSHELRTPLTAITGWGDTLLSSEDLNSEDCRRGLNIILGESKRLTRLVEDLLEFTRLQDGRFTLNVQRCDIRMEFEDTVFMYINRLKQDGILLEYLDNDDDIPEIDCDPARLRQVFLNILDNAAKHAGDGRRITASVCAEKDAVVFRIRDFGQGIPEEELSYVKMRFYKGSSKARGSGIGLAVCEEIVTMHRGTLTLENAEGGGVLVTITIPYS